MDNTLLRSISPYIVGLVLAIALFVYAGGFQYTERAGQLGPDIWPRLAIALMAGSCLFEIGRRMLVANQDAIGVIEALDRTEDDEEPPPSYPMLLISGVIVISIYAVALAYFGFIISTFLFLAAFMYLGRYRNHVVIWSVAAGVTLLCGVLFLRIAYVSLPRGIPPFDKATDIFFALPGL